MHHSHNYLLVALSIGIAIFASYTALDLANSVTAARGRARYAWLFGGSVAMGVGIWSMHFIAMLAFSVPGVQIAYDIPLLILSVLVAVAASAVTLYVVSRDSISVNAYVVSSLFMGAAIAGMHYIGIGSMRMGAEISWNFYLVLLSLAIAVLASFAALWLAFRFRDDFTERAFWLRGGAGVVMGFAISGMHFTAMAAMRITATAEVSFRRDELLATSGLAAFVIAATLLVLGIAVTGSIIDRALSRRVAMTEQVTTILESITDAFFSVDRNWNFTYVNKMAHDTIKPMTGRDPGNVLGKNLWETVPTLQGTRYQLEYQQAMATGNPNIFEDYLQPLQMWLEVRVYPSRDGLSIYFRNITSRKQAEQEREKAIRSRDEFLSVASHELRTPITSMKLQTQLMKKNIAKGDPTAFAPERVTKLVDQFDRQVNRITRLVEDMLDISRIATGRLTMVREEMNLCEVVKEISERYMDIFTAAGGKLEVHCGGATLGFWDHIRVEQVISNLLTNAVKYAPGKPAHVSVAPENGMAVLKVRDEGRGISPEDQKRIFKKFERAVSSEDGSGLGLGLFIVRSILVMHQGSIEVESELGKGTTFIVKLPMGIPERPLVSEPAPSAEILS